MSKKFFSVFLVAALIAVAAVVFVNLDDGRNEDRDALFPDLDMAAVNDIASIELQSAGGGKVRLARSEQNLWQVVDKDNHPADTVKIRNLLLALSEAEKIEEKTSQPDQYAQLGVGDTDAATGGGLLVQLSNAQQQWGLILGNPSRQLSEGQFARIAGEQASWLMNRRLSLTADSQAWLDKRIVHIEPANLHRIAVKKEASEPLEIVREKRGDPLKLAAMPEGAELKDSGALNRIAAIVDYLDFREVYVRNDDFALPDTAIRATFTTLDGLEIVMQAYQVGESLYAVIAAQDNEQVMDQFNVAEDKRAEVRGKAAALGERLSRWYYRLQDSLYESLNVEPESLTTQQ